MAIVVIGILAAITIASYTGITQKAVIATLQSDLKNVSIQLEIDKTTDNSETYPATKGTAANGTVLKSSPDTTFSYIYDSVAKTYCLTATNSNGVSYYINSDTKTPTEGSCPAVIGNFVMGWGGTNHDYGYSLVQTSDGGYAVTGSTQSYTAGGADMFLAKYSSDGTINNCLPVMCQDGSITSVNRTVTGVNRNVTSNVILAP